VKKLKMLDLQPGDFVAYCGDGDDWFVLERSDDDVFFLTLDGEHGWIALADMMELQRDDQVLRNGSWWSGVGDPECYFE
jgi:hypothetical protein